MCLRYIHWKFLCHILLLLLIAEILKFAIQNYNFLFVRKLPLQVWWICCSIGQLIGEIHCTHHLIHFTHSLLLNLIVSCVSFVHLCTFVFQIIVPFSVLYFLLVPLSCMPVLSCTVCVTSFCMCLACLVCPLCPLITWLQKCGILFGTITLLLFTLAV